MADREAATPPDHGIEDPASGFGKWGEAGVPHRGWSCIDIEDRGSASDICKMCEKQRIRFVHFMSHPEYPDVLECGCDCAGHMEECEFRLMSPTIPR